MRMVRVTDALSILNRYGGVSKEVLTKAAGIGTEVHKYGHLYAKGVYFEAQADIKGWVDELEIWMDENVCEILDAEIEVVHKGFGYVGHPDLIARLKGDRTFSLIDYKRTAGIDWAVGLQLAAYEEAAKIKYRRKFKQRLALHIPKEGRCRAVRFSSQNDFPLFLNCLNLYKGWKGV